MREASFFRQVFRRRLRGRSGLKQVISKLGVGTASQEFTELSQKLSRGEQDVVPCLPSAILLRLDHALGGAGSEVRPHHFINRELSWLEFNGRVLRKRVTADVPLAERCKFQGIVASNLDEFFMVRVAGLKQLLAGGVAESGADGMLRESSSRRSPRASTTWWRPCIAIFSSSSRPNWAPRRVWPFCGLSSSTRAKGISKHALQPQRVARAHAAGRRPGPSLSGPAQPAVSTWHRLAQRAPARGPPLAHLRCCASSGGSETAVEIPPSSPHRAAFILLETSSAMHAGELFPGFRVDGCHCFRVTRDFDLSLDEDDADDLLKTIQRELRRRERNQAVRLELAHDTPAEVEGFCARLCTCSRKTFTPPRDRCTWPICLLWLCVMNCGSSGTRRLRPSRWQPLSTRTCFG